MNQTTLLSPAWSRALTLAERCSTLSADIVSLHRDEKQDRLANRRLLRWQSQPQFSSESVITQRLDALGIDEAGLTYLLGEPVDTLCWRMPDIPGWLVELMDAYAVPAGAYTDIAPGEEELGFLELVQPQVDLACYRLYEGVLDLIDRWPFLPFDPERIEDILLANLLTPLLMRIGRTMVLELNVARLQDRLSGITPEERFLSFIEHLRSPEASMAILADYPVLARQLVLCVNQWTEVSLEFLDRLCADWQRIRRRFTPESDPGILLELIGGAGDTHRGGRSVMIARFDSGFQIVYKPKSMAVDVHFQELLLWLNGRGCSPPLRTLNILDCATHGWVEYVEYQPCDTEEQVENFYRRLGLYLALLYAINASDFHLENLIAAGEHPLLIDLETLFNPEFNRLDERDAFQLAQRAMIESVLVAGMLPQRMWSGEDFGGLDISGLGGAAGQLTPDRLPRADASGTDEMHYVREYLELTGEANRPMLNGVEISALDHVEEVVGGFKEMVRLLLDNRDELLARGGPLERFDHDEIRVLIRPTRTYDQLLFESFHPDVLHDGLDRDLLLDRLWLVLSDRPFMAPVIVAEQTELQQGDIPVFTTRPSSLALKSGCGSVMAGVLTESGMALARRRIMSLDNRDMRRQEWFIRASLATLMPYDYGITSATNEPYRLQGNGVNAGREQLLDAARDIAQRLVETAFLGEKDACWIGMEMLAGANWDIGPVGMDLYSGTPGIALFLAYAGAILENECYTDLARRGVAAMLRHFERFGRDLPGIGGFEGWGGTLYALVNMAALWHDSALLDRGQEVVDVLAGFIDQDDDFGIQRGAAGAIGALISYYHCRPSARTLEAAIVCGDHLLASAQIMPRGIGWVPSGSASRPLTGFAHGASGIAWALFALAGETGEERYRVAAQQAVAYERSLFSPEAGNWPDLRPIDESAGNNAPDAPRYPVAWCHGAAGIGLTRLAAFELFRDEELYNEALTALDTTVRRGFGQTHCLCHGDMGNLELLLLGGCILNDEKWSDEARRLVHQVLNSIDRHGWYCGGPGGVELPGLMHGIAGIGYQMLRVAEPEQVPSLLTLAYAAQSAYQILPAPGV